MGLTKSFLCSSVGKKQMMAISGLMLCGFLVTHLIGNFLIFKGANAFNQYSHMLISNPLIEVAEFVLAFLFLFHIVMGIHLTLENKKARPQKYFMRKASGEGATFASSTMIYTGTIILIFLIYHLINFKYGAHYDYVGPEGITRDLHRLVMEFFQSKREVIFYIIAMIALGIHLSHGFQSIFKSLGLVHPRYIPWIVRFGYVFAIAVAGGFISIPVWCYLQGVHP